MAKRPCFSNVWRQEILTSTHSLLWSPSWQYIYRRLKKKAINQLKSKYWLLSQYPKLIQSTHWLAVLALCEVRVRLTHKSGTSPSRRISSLALPVPYYFCCPPPPPPFSATKRGTLVLNILLTSSTLGHVFILDSRRYSLWLLAA